MPGLGQISRQQKNLKLTAAFALQPLQPSSSLVPLSSQGIPHQAGTCEEHGLWGHKGNDFLDRISCSRSKHEGLSPARSQLSLAHPGLWLKKLPSPE